MNLKSEQGNVLVYILIAVALFAALGFAVSNMMRSSGGSIAGERAVISISEVLDYAKSMRESVQLLRISKECDETQISFERQPFDGTDTDYVNTNAPSDYSCHIFHPNGAGVAYYAGPEEVSSADWIFTGANDGENIGNECNEDHCADLIAILPGISRSMCKEINKKLNIAKESDYLTQEDNYFEVDFFQGSYSYEARLSDSATNNALEGKSQGCVRGNSSPQDPDAYYFYQVLLAR
ncbi:MAG: hypothetical protein KAJ40_08705 [Alphaproteobacteria bacterium]|nr:hypothetical protein [Alphaproteobacteria bacterium]